MRYLTFSDGVTLHCSLAFAELRKAVLGTTYKAAL